MECLSYCIANKIDLNRLDDYFETDSSHHLAVRSRDVLKITHPERSEVLIFVFRNGTVVSWGIKRYQIKEYLNIFKSFADKPIPVLVRDQCIYLSGDKTAIEPHGYFEVDCLTIDRASNSEDLKLSISYGFSQSVKLQYFETTLEALIDKYTPLTQSLSSKGKISVRRKEIRKIIGELLSAKSEMNLVSNFLYMPKYFWQHPTLEEHYTMLERYLHIQRRVNALNHRLDILNEIFNMFNGYLESRHSHNLEIIIILIITFETLFALLDLHV